MKIHIVKKVRVGKNDEVEKVLWQEANGDINQYKGNEIEVTLWNIKEVLQQGSRVEMIKPNGASGGELRLDQWGNIYEECSEGTLKHLPRF